MRYNSSKSLLTLSLLLYSLPTSATIPDEAHIKSHSDIIKAYCISDFQSSIINKISHNIEVPFGTQGTSVKLQLKLDQVGNIIYANADSPNVLVNQAVKSAAFTSSPLPIDLKHPETFEHIIINIKIK